MKLTESQRKKVIKFAKSLMEGSDDLRAVIKNISIDQAQELADLYYSIADNVKPMVDLLNSLNQENSSHILKTELNRFKKIDSLIQDCDLGKVL